MKRHDGCEKTCKNVIECEDACQGYEPREENIKRKAFKLEVDMENAAFNEDGEASRIISLTMILGRVKERIFDGETEGKVMDYNGNTVGSFWTEEGDE